jgi:TetR/AcrR family transcriptional regulator, tetracycline repressor protein
MVGGPMDGPNAFALDERLLQLLADAGLDATDAARAAYLLIVYVFGHVAREVADAHQPGSLPPAAERVAARDRALAAAPTMAGYIATDQYRWGLRRILDGITARVTASPSGGSAGGGAALPA